MRRVFKAHRVNKASRPQGIQGPAGKPFSIKKTYATVALLNANGPNDLSEGDFAIIDSTVDDADNAKLFVWTGGKASLVTDMSGAQGVQGPQGKQACKVHKDRKVYKANRRYWRNRYVWYEL